jgi:sulfur relay (sulfurtransferase) DsrF/TusC family protein
MKIVMDTLLVILRKPPYGVINAAEAVRHAGGASGSDYRSILYLVDSGVYTARKNQDISGTEFSGIGESIELLSDEMEIYADGISLKEYNLNEDDLIEGVKIDDGNVLQQALKESQAVMIF